MKVAPSDDATVVTAQLGRPPRGSWRVVVRCDHGMPQVIATKPLLDDGTPFPTLYWLTCPLLTERAYAAESAGEVRAWCERLRDDVGLMRRHVASDSAYRRARMAENGGGDVPRSGGVGGVRDPRSVKCLHAHVAVHLAGIEDVIGRGVLGDAERTCRRGACARLGVSLPEER